MLKPSNERFPIPRIEVTSLGFHSIERRDSPNSPMDFDDSEDEFDPEVNPNDIQRSCRILISDAVNIREIYNPEKLKSFNFADLPADYQKGARKLENNASIIHPELPLLQNSQYQETKSHGCPESPQLWDSIEGWLLRPLSVCPIKRKSKGEAIDLPVTGPSGVIQPFSNFFDIAVHQDTTDDELLETNKDRYMAGCIGVSVKSFVDGVRDFSYDRPLKCEFYDVLFSLKLDCIVFSDSKLVTVTAKWFMEEEIGGDGKKIQATEASCIRGKLYLHSEAFGGTRSVLLETPGDQVFNVKHGQTIPLLKSVVAIPYMSSFKVVAALVDPIKSCYVEGHTVSFVQSEENIQQKFNACITGYGAKIEVDVTMEPNVRDVWVD